MTCPSPYPRVDLALDLAGDLVRGHERLSGPRAPTPGLARRVPRRVRQDPTVHHARRRPAALRRPPLRGHHGEERSNVRSGQVRSVVSSSQSALQDTEVKTRIKGEL